MGWKPTGRPCYVLDQARLRPHESSASTRGFIYLTIPNPWAARFAIEEEFRHGPQNCNIPLLSSHPHASRRARCLSELLGTYLLVLIGPGTVAAVSLAQGITAFEALLIIGFAFGATVAIVILLLGRISGAHINPAVTLAHTIAGKTSLEMFLPYISFQVLGGLLGAFTVKLIFSQFGSPVDLGTTKLASGVSLPVGTLLEAVGTFVLAMSGFVASLRVHKNPGEAALIGSTLFVIILALGPLTNASLNPVRSLGPALASGYLTNLYVYLIGPLVGGLIAGLVFRFFERSRIGQGSRIVCLC